MPEAAMHKTIIAKASEDKPLEYIMSDGTVDRVGDIIDPEGWEFRNFANNPIALFNHDSRFIVGHWKDVRIENGALRGRLEVMRKGISERLDEVIAAVEAGILRAVSVGFRALESEPLKNGGRRFTKSELIECSLVSIPANPNALQVAKALNLSADAQAVIFGKTATSDHTATAPRQSPGKSAVAQSHFTEHRKMTPISQRIEDAQQRLVGLRDKLTDHLNEIGDEPDETAVTVTEELNEKIAHAEKTVESLTQAETRLKLGAEPANGGGNIVETTTRAQRPFAVPAKKVDPKDYAIRTAVVALLSHVMKKDPDFVRQQRYGDDEPTKAVVDHFLVSKAASAPAMTSTSGWASQLVETVNADFMQSLMPASVYPGLSARGLRLNFGRAGVINIPSRSATPTIAGSFVAEGAAIPVRQGSFTSTTLTPKKMAVISTFTREIAQHSTPAIEGLIRDAIREDTSVALDSVLLDDIAASTVRPAGVRNGVAVTTATAGGGFAALVGDIKNLTGALVTATNGNLRSPVWIMNPTNALSVALTQNAGGDFPFKQEINGGVFQGYPVIVSSTVTAGMVILVDAADFVSVTGDEPLFDVSDQATLHMEDTNPTAIGTAGAPNTVAAPVRSLWQTDTIGLRMILPMNWAFRRAGVVAWTQAVTW